jgi:hypothetical protein
MITNKDLGEKAGTGTAGLGRDVSKEGGSVRVREAIAGDFLA